jgi:hypothetical protein
MACAIFDRYLMQIGHWNFQRSNVLKLAVICLLLAAKLEEPMQPSFNKMINILNPNE